MTINGKCFRLLQKQLNVLRGEMEFATGVKVRPIRKALSKALKIDIPDFGTKSVLKIGVRRCDHVADAVLASHLDHGAGGGEVRRAVVHARENVCMNVDHYHLQFRRLWFRGFWSYLLPVAAAYRDCWSHGPVPSDWRR